jgi:ankyrin repeat protein
MGAAYSGNLDLVRLMYERGADFKRLDDSGQGPLSRAEEKQHREVVAFLKNPPPLTPPVDEISFTYPLQDRVLQEIFNFERRERVTLIRHTKTGPVEAVCREPFADFKDRAALRKAFDEHRRRGGTTPEEELFPETLNKGGRLQL